MKFPELLSKLSSTPFTLHTDSDHLETTNSYGSINVIKASFEASRFHLIICNDFLLLMT